MYLQRSLAQTKLSVLQLAFLMKRGFFLSQPKSASSAAQPASDSNAAQLASDSSAAQRASDNAARPPITCRSIADVDSWLKANTAALGLSVEAKRIKDVVEVLSARPKPRKEDVQEFFSPLGGEAEGSAETETIARRLSRKMINGCDALATKLFLDWSRMAFKLSP